MSKIGRKPISTEGVTVEVKGNEIFYKGKKSSGVHALPAGLKAEVSDKQLKITCNDLTRQNKMLWGMHRAILANEIKGSTEGFKQDINIKGVGFKAAISGRNMTFSLGFSHKINFELPEGITVTVDNKGENLTVAGSNKELVGLVSSQIRSLKPAEPYKGKGITLAGEEIIRKAGKTKSA
jgi:large subunit ribosomal protein L6